MGNFLMQLITILIIYISAGVSANSPGPRGLIWLFIFILNLNVYSEFAVRRAHRKDFPFHWLCHRCKAKRRRFFAESTDADGLARLVAAHNRAAHLEEH